MKRIKNYAVAAILFSLGLASCLAKEAPATPTSSKSVALVPTVSTEVVKKPQDVKKQASPISGTSRKARFFAKLLPLVQAENEKLLQIRAQIQVHYAARDDLNAEALEQLYALAKTYRIKQFDPKNEARWTTLLVRVDVVPPSLALAQAANESAWGTSRFARDANNYYGQWCFSKGCGLVPQKRGANQNHEVAKFSTPAHSVRSYMRNLNRHAAYAPLRKMRTEMRAANKTISGEVLANGLKNYSSRGMAYVKEIQAMIRYNKLQQYD